MDHRVHFLIFSFETWTRWSIFFFFSEKTHLGYLVEAFCSDKDGNRTSRRERHICCVCGAKTSWRCLECKEWFCMENPADTKNKKRRYSLVQSTVDNKLVEFQNACFHNKHREAWEVDK